MTGTAEACPMMLQTATAAVSAREGCAPQASGIVAQPQPQTVAADNADPTALRIRRGVQRGSAVLTPAVPWTKGRWAHAYHCLIKHPDGRERLAKRRTAGEPRCAWGAQGIDAKATQKQ